MKNLLAGAIAASLAWSASAAVVTFSWSGAGYSASGTIDYTESGATDVFNSGSFSLFQGLTLLNSGDLTLDSTSTFSATGTTVDEMTLISTGLVGSSFSDGWAFGFLDDGGFAWRIQDFTSSAFSNLGDNMTAPTLTVVPEPETYVAVAGAGLVAFGLFRRRAVAA